MMARRANAIRPAKPALQEALLAMSTPKFSTHPRLYGNRLPTARKTVPCQGLAAAHLCGEERAMKPVGIYLRVSTNNGQTTDTSGGARSGRRAVPLEGR